MNTPNERRKRTLTDDDVQAIAIALREQITKDIYQDLGAGVFAIIKRTFIAVVLGIAAYGAAKGMGWK